MTVEEDVIFAGCDPVCQITKCVEGLIPKDWQELKHCSGEISVGVSIAKTQAVQNSECLRRKGKHKRALVDVLVVVDKCKADECVAGYIETYLTDLIEFAKDCEWMCAEYSDTEIYTQDKPPQERRSIRFAIDYIQKREKVITDG